MTPTSWRPGCPVPLGQLRYVAVRYWGFDHQPHAGELVLNADAVVPMLHVLRSLWDIRYPVRRMRLVDDYGGSDDASVAADNTVGVQLPARRGYDPMVGARVRPRDRHRPGREPVRRGRRTCRRRPGAGTSPGRRRARASIRAGDASCCAFASIGWGWGGDFVASKDYQHFSSTGR